MLIQQINVAKALKILISIVCGTCLAAKEHFTCWADIHFFLPNSIYNQEYFSWVIVLEILIGIGVICLYEYFNLFGIMLSQRDVPFVVVSIVIFLVHNFFVAKIFFCIIFQFFLNVGKSVWGVVGRKRIDTQNFHYNTKYKINDINSLFFFNEA